MVARLKEAYGDDLVSVVLHGSAAHDNSQKQHLNLNTICILRRVGVTELRKGEKVVSWWQKKKQPIPLFQSVEEIRNSHDVFPIEYMDIQQSHRLLFGEDLFTPIAVDRKNHRTQLEYELRASLLRLRQKYLALHPNEKDVVRLMVESIPSFATMARHALIVAGASGPAKKRDVFDASAARFALDAAPFQTVLNIRDGTEKLSGQQVHSLFASYLEQITKLGEVLDHL